MHRLFGNTGSLLRPLLSSFSVYLTEELTHSWDVIIISNPVDRIPNYAWLLGTQVFLPVSYQIIKEYPEKKKNIKN